MSDWVLAQSEPSDALARLHYFSMNKQQGGRSIEFLITVRESIPGADRSGFSKKPAATRLNGLCSKTSPLRSSA